MLEATAKFVKANCKDWKESNPNMQKEALNVVKTMTENCERIPKRVLAVYNVFMCEKIGDIKVAKPIAELFVSLSEFLTCKFVIGYIVKNGAKSKIPKNIQESCNVITTLTDEFGAGQIPAKAVIDFAVFAVSNSNPQVRTAAFKLFAMLYKHMGEPIKNYLTDIKDSTLKLVEAEFAKVTPLKKGEFVSGRELKGEAVEEVAAAGGSGSGGLDLPREDISKKLKPAILDKFKDKAW